MATDTVVIPRRYFLKSPFDSVIKNMPTEDKALWNKRPNWTFVQVYSIQLLKSDELDQIYGTIVVGRGPAFNREFGLHNRHDIDIDPHGFVRLCGPNCPLWASNYNLVYPMLYRENHPDDFYHPARGVKYYDDKEGLLVDYEDIPTLDLPGIDGIFISVPDSEIYPFDELIVKDVETTCGTVRVAYSIFTYAADSYLTIKLVEWNGKGPAANIYGKVYASNTRLNDERAKSLVFDRNRDEETLSIMPGQYVPLQRPNNIASFGHSLVLTLEIFHKNMDSSDDDLLILSDTFSTKAKFYSKKSDVDGITETYEFCGKLATFEVQVCWLPYWSLATGR